MAGETINGKEEINLGLVQRCQENDPEAYREFFSQYNRRIFNTAYRILGEEASAEDALQETLLNVFRGLPNFRGESKISTWIGRITINVCLGMLRKGKNRLYVDLEDDSTMELPAEVNAASDPLEHTSLAETRAGIEEAFRRMSPKQSVVVRLHDMEGRTIQEIARMLHCPLGTVKSRLFYGRQEFKDIYEARLQGRTHKVTVN
jgi:RNA polymerase sigma-70 factor (ECF subfamily)